MLTCVCLCTDTGFGSSNNQIHASRDSVLYDSRMSGVNGSLYATPTQVGKLVAFNIAIWT